MTPGADMVQHYEAAFRRRFAAKPRTPAAVPWLSDLRSRAFDAFSTTGFPTTRQEDWRFTSVAALSETPFAMPNGGRASQATIARVAATSGTHRMVFLNGRFQPALSTLAALPKGVRLESLKAVLESPPQVLEQHLGQHARFTEHPFAALSTAFLEDGAFLYVPAGIELGEPVEVLFASTSSKGEPRVSFPRVLVVVEQGGSAAVVEVYAGLDGGTYFTNAVTETVVADGARLQLCRVQREGPAGYHVAVSQSTQGRDSNVNSCSIALGGLLSRHDIGAVMNGQGGQLVLNGLTMVTGQQHVDHHTIIDHAQPHCESHELFNGIFDEQSRGVFNGRIIVRPGAQRTDSKQTSNNLLLSRDARADTQPQLEIYADDVKCTHGATLGPVDEASLFYLQSRGLDRGQARALLTYGFGADVVARAQPASIRGYLDALVLESLPGRLGAAA